MAGFLLLFFCILIGFGLQKVKRIPQNFHKSLNSFIIFVSFPALVLLKTPELLKTLSFSSEVLIPLSMAWIQFAFSVIFFLFLAKRMKWNREVTGAVILTAGLGNTSFVGFPLLVALVGEKALPVAILIDQGGSFFVLSTVGVIFASTFLRAAPSKESNLSKRTTSTPQILLNCLKGILFFPPFQALMLASIFFTFEVQFNTVVLQTLKQLADTLIPLALIAVGFQLRFSWHLLKAYKNPLALGLLFKLFLFPAMLTLFFVSFLKETNLNTYVTLLESAMASMITAGVVAEDFGYDTQVAQTMVGLSIIFSLVTVPLWAAYLRPFFTL